MGKPESSLHVDPATGDSAYYWQQRFYNMRALAVSLVVLLACCLVKHA